MINAEIDCPYIGRCRLNDAVERLLRQRSLQLVGMVILQFIPGNSNIPEANPFCLGSYKTIIEKIGQP